MPFCVRPVKGVLQPLLDKKADLKQRNSRNSLNSNLSLICFTALDTSIPSLVCNWINTKSRKMAVII
jgi:hypothetical protein